MKPRLSIFNRFPFLRFTILFVTGILIDNQYNPNSLFIKFLIVIIALVSISTLFIKRNILKNILSGIQFIILFICFGILYSYLFKQLQFSKELPIKGTYTGYVLDKVPSTNNRYKLTVLIESVKTDENFLKAHEKILVYSYDSITNTKIEPGSELIFKTNLNAISYNNNPGEFNYKRYLYLKGIRYQAYIKNKISTSASKRFNILIFALRVRTKLMNRYHEAGIYGDEYAVLGALTLGDTNYISNEVKTSFSASGAMHVLSVSGLHVGIIFMVLNFILKSLNRNNKLKIIKVIILLGSLWIYAFITGLSPSVMRSTTMFSILVLGENINRKTNTYNTLAVSAFLLLLINPFLVFNVGFQLSYLAVLSIVFFQPRIAALVNTKNFVSKYIWELLTVSIAAQLGTTPISLYYFHQFPNYFLLSNFIVVPAAAIILYLGIIFFMVSFIPFLNNILAFFLNSFTFGLNYCVKTIEHLPASINDGIDISFNIVLLLYLLLILLTMFFYRKKAIYALLSLSIIAYLAAVENIKEINSYLQKKIIIYNNSTETLISYIDGKNHHYYTNNVTPGNYSKQLIKFSTDKFRTTEAIQIKQLLENKCTNQTVQIKINELSLTDYNTHKINISSNGKPTLLYNQDKSNVIIQQPLNLISITTEDINRSKKRPNENKIFNLKNEGALIINLE